MGSPLLEVSPSFSSPVPEFPYQPQAAATAPQQDLRCPHRSDPIRAGEGEGFPRVEFPARQMRGRFPSDLKPRCALVMMACKYEATGWGLDGAAGKRK